MNVDIKFRNVLANDVKVMSAECEVFIWREGNEYAVVLSMRQDIPKEDYRDEMEEVFLMDVRKKAYRIDKSWTLVDINNGPAFGKVIGQRQVTFY